MSYPKVTLDGHEVTLSPENLAIIGQQVKAQVVNLSFPEAIAMGTALFNLKKMLSP